MNDFGRSAQEQREFERVRYSGSNVLKNKLGIRDDGELGRAERLLVAERLAEGLPASARRLNVNGLRAVHRHLFQDIYPWAGQFRGYTTGRGQAPFARPEFIQPALTELFDKLNGEKNLVGLERDTFANRAAHYVNEINAVHPFIEGNGRMQRVWLRNLADQAGYLLRLKVRSPEEWNEASRRGFHGDNSAVAELILKFIQPITNERTREERVPRETKNRDRNDERNR